MHSLISNLPDEIIVHIISFLDLYSIVQITQINKQFKRFITTKILSQHIVFSDKFCIQYAKIKKSKFWHELIRPIIIENNYVEIDDIPAIISNENYTKYNDLLTYINDCSVVLHTGITMVLDKYHYFMVIQFQTENICMIAIMESLANAWYVENYTKNICKKILPRRPQILKRIEKQTDYMILQACASNTKLTDHLQKQISSIYLEIMKNNEQDIETNKWIELICIEAINFDPYSITYLQYCYPVEENCLMALQLDEKLISRIDLEYLKSKPQTDKMKSIVHHIHVLRVKICGTYLENIRRHDQTPIIVYEAVKQNPYSIQYANPNLQFEDICLMAVNQDGTLLRYIDPTNQTLKICLAATKQNFTSTIHISDLNQQIICEKYFKTQSHEYI